MPRRFLLSLPPEERAVSLDTKQSRFLANLARELDALGPDPKGDTPSCFHQRRGPPAFPVVRPGGRVKP